MTAFTVWMTAAFPAMTAFTAWAIAACAAMTAHVVQASVSGFLAYFNAPYSRSIIIFALL
jgi:hypothetical protein